MSLLSSSLSSFSSCSHLPVLLSQYLTDPSTRLIRLILALVGKIDEQHKSLLTPEAIRFLAVLHRSFDTTRQTLLKARQLRQAQFDGGALPDFLPQTAHIRENSSWKCAPPAPGLRDRRVEITGPVDKKMVINALNSG